MTLDELAIKHGTDKSSLGHDYCKIYEKYFDHLKDEPIKFLELGYGGYKDPKKGGESAAMWREYFTQAEIAVTDIYRKTNIPNGVDFIVCSQDDVNEKIADSANFDIIIDDASHINKLTIQSFKLYFPLLEHGGLYVIEDLHSSYDTYYKDANPDPAKGETAMNFLKRLTDEINLDFLKPRYRLGYDIEWIHFYRELCIIKKR